ncbi:MAG: dihydrofolate reductase family protein [Ktedonobacterales bacterium]
MRKIIVSEFVTLDGVMQAPGNSDEDAAEGFTHGGWAWPYWHDDIDAYIDESMREADTCLLGRKTWQSHATAFEPLADDAPESAGLSTMRKYVVSNTLTSADAWRNSTLISGDVIAQVKALKEQPGKNIGINGSSQLIHALAQHDLIDAYHLLVFPVVVGSGKKVFADDARMKLRLIEARPIPSGVTLLRYAVERPA